MKIQSVEREIRQALGSGNLALEQAKAAALGSSLAHEVTRMEAERSSWRKAVLETDLIGKQVRDLAAGSVYAQVAKELTALQSPAMTIARQYQDLLGSGSAIGSAYKAWQESERVQKEQMRKMFDPMVDIRQSVLGDTTTQQLIKELKEGSSVRGYIEGIAERSLGIGSVAQMLTQQVEDSRDQTKRLLESLGDLAPENCSS